jgi:hypothetical protein
MPVNRYDHVLSMLLRSCLTLLAIASFGCDRSPLTVDEVIERNTKAMGGRAAIEAVKSIQVDLHIVDPGFEVDGTYRAARPGRMRIDVVADGKHVFTEAFDGQRGWQWKGEGKEREEATPKATAALRHGVELPGKLFGLHEVKQHGHQIDLVGREKVDGINYYVLRLILNDGYATNLCIDPGNWLVTRRRDVRPLHVDIDPRPTTIEMNISDFRKVSGVYFGFASTDTDLETGKVLERTSVREIKVNSQFDQTIFDKL